MVFHGLSKTTLRAFTKVARYIKQTTEEGHEMFGNIVVLFADNILQ